MAAASELLEEVALRFLAKPGVPIDVQLTSTISVYRDPSDTLRGLNSAVQRLCTLAKLPAGETVSLWEPLGGEPVAVELSSVVARFQRVAAGDPLSKRFHLVEDDLVTLLFEPCASECGRGGGFGGSPT